MTKPSGLLAGICLTVLSGLALASMDTMGKYLSGKLPVIEIVWARYFFHTLIMAAWLTRRGNVGFLRTSRPMLQVVRGLMLLVGSTLIYLSLTQIPLSDATAVQFFAPVLVTVWSVIFLGERIGVPRIAAVLAGFGGVLLIIRPGVGSLDPYLLLPLGAAVMFSVYFMLTRELSGPQENAATLFNTTAVGALALTVAVPFVWQVPTGPQLALMVAIGTLGAIGHFCLVNGFAFASASALAPFLYGQVLFASLYSSLLLGDPLRPNVAAGALVLVGSGIFIWWRENRRRPLPTVGRDPA